MYRIVTPEDLEERLDSASSQRDTYYKDLTGRGDKPIIYPGSGERSALDASGICQVTAPMTVIRGDGFQLTDSQVKEFGKGQVKAAREVADFGTNIRNSDNPDGTKPSGIGFGDIIKTAFEPLGYTVPRNGAIENEVQKPKEPVRQPGEGDVSFAKKIEKYNEQLDARHQKSLDQMKPWIISQLQKGNPVVIQGNFTPKGHIVTVVGYNSKGYIVHDSYGDSTKGYGNSQNSGQYVNYPYGKYTIGYGYIIKKK